MKKSKKTKLVQVIFCENIECECNLENEFRKLFPQFEINCLKENEFNILKESFLDIENLSNNQKQSLANIYNRVFNQTFYKTYTTTMTKRLEQIYNLYL
tara:strand:- start:844 stop:1140 length:297 start_codon:yes stop_codon:yes gene_type:complete